MLLPEIHWSTALIACTTLLPLAWGLRAKARGQTWRGAVFTFLAFPMWVLVQLSSGQLLPQLASLLVHAGLAFAAAAVLLAVWRVSVRFFAVPAVLCLVLGMALHGATQLFERINQTTAKPETTARPANDPQVVLLVELGPDDQLKEILPILDRFGALVRRAFPRVTLAEDVDLAQIYLVHVPESVAAALIDALRADTENVDYVARDRNLSVWPLQITTPTDRQPSRTPTDDPYLGRQWALEATGGLVALERLKQLQPKRRARLAIVDTGVDGGHEDLATESTYRDKVGHGTHCAGIAAAVADNGKGIASFNLEGRWIELRSYPALAGLGTAPLSQIAEAIIQAGEDRCDVISLSLGAPALVDGDRVLELAIQYVRRLGSIVVAAAGNESAPARHFIPAGIEGVVCVTATGPDGRAASFTNTVADIGQPLAAPGVDIWSLRPGSGYVAARGTSMACPYVAGVLAVVRALRPNLSADEAYALLARTAADHPDAQRTGRLIRVDRILQALAVGT